MSKQSKLIPVTLSAESYARLEAMANEQERHPIRQAQYLIRHALDGDQHDDLIGWCCATQDQPA